MGIVGLITEYNPFHNGHLYHIEQAKKVTGADTAIVIMSGNFVQRGVPAITDKYTRTHMALVAGADIVLELPVYYATASAEQFAYGAVASLHALGIVDAICFGSEEGDCSLLTQIADILVDEPDDYRIALSRYLKDGLTYPKARAMALSDYTGDPAIERIISSPNNILGIEYIKALKRLHSSVKPYTIKRKTNTYHETELTGKISSASAIREQFLKCADTTALSGTIPDRCLTILQSATEKTFPVTQDDFSTLLYYKLLSCTEEQLQQYMGIQSELAKRIINQFHQYQNFSQFAELLKTKNQTHTAITRALCHILLDIKKSTDYEYLPYIRLLGFRKTASPHLKTSKKNCSIPIITKVGDAKKMLSGENYCLFERDLFASHLYNRILHDKFHHDIRDEYHYGIIRVD